jgi:hypothetical protein
MANSPLAKSPATGASASAASSAVSIWTPLGKRMTAVTITMNRAMALVQIPPSTASARSKGSSSGPSPLSATDDCR